MALSGFRMHVGGTTGREFPNGEKSKVTVGENVVGEPVAVAKLWKMMVVMLLGVGLIVYGIVEGLTWQRGQSGKEKMR